MDLSEKTAHIPDHAAPLPSPQTPNPWHDDAPSASRDEPPRLHTPDPAALDPSVLAGIHTEAEPRVDAAAQHEVLREFDPLAHREEQAARDAWERAAPRPPRTPSPPPPPSKDSPPRAPEPAQPATPLSASFNSLAALARTFSIPSLPRARPMSLDSAKPVPSPATISAFASQQRPPRKDDANEGTRSSTPSGSGSASPVPRKDREEPVFDFQVFLDQMKTKSAEPVAKYLRSFLSNFAKRTFTVSDQVKIINDFLNFISTKMRESDVWRNATDAEFDNAMEGIEKLVMNRLYEFTFTPQIVQAIPPRPVTADDLERDRVLSQRIALFGWIEERHLDIPEGEGSKGFLMFAQQELLKINHYKAPRDKLICILNCCKVIFGLIRHLRKDEGADSFVPILIFVVLKANPEHLLSNVEFINRFRNPAKLQSEAGYYLSSLMGAVSFIETMDHTSLSNITQEEFEKNVEDAIQSLPPSEPHTPSGPDSRPGTPHRTPHRAPSLHAGEESAQPLSLPAPGATLSDDARRLLQRTGDAVSKPLSAIGRIFSEALDGAEGRLTYLPGPFAPFELGREGRAEHAWGGGGGGAPPVPHWSHPDQVRQYQAPQTPAGEGAPPPLQTPYKPRVRRAPSSSGGSPGPAPDDTPSRSRSPALPPAPAPATHHALALGPSRTLEPPRVQALAGAGSAHVSRTPTPALDFGGMQAEIDSAHAQAGAAARATLAQIFPGVDAEVVEWVLEANGGDLGSSIEALLEISRAE